MPDHDDYPSGPTGMAMICRDKIADLQAEQATATRARTTAINRRLRHLKELLRFAETRAGYSRSAP